MLRGQSKEPQPQLIGGGAGNIDGSDDEEIDEGGAFNSDDDLMYGDFFSSSKKTSSSGVTSNGTRPKGNANSDENESADGDDSDDDDGSSKSSSSSSEEDWAASSSHEDEQDDGGQYMLDLLDNLDKQVTPSGNDGRSSNGGKIVKGRGEGGKIALGTVASEAAVRLPEAKFQAAALAAISPVGEGSRGKLTLDSLMGGISDTAGFTSVQRSMRALSSGIFSNKEGGRLKKLETTALPVSRVISGRARRKFQYASTSKDVTRWQGAVHEQRDAETLDFRTNKGGAKSNRVTRDTLVEKFEASNEFERELQYALERAGMEDEWAMERRERENLTGKDVGFDDGQGHVNENNIEEDDDDMCSNRITLAEYKKRHAELAKLRALMFYEEQKRHRINKIKSKKYRKIRKRQRERLKDAEDEAARLDDPDGTLHREMVERDEMDHMKERMTLAHKNTSKWARRVLRRGAKMDVEERRALSLQIAKGEELRRKFMGEEDGDSSSASEEETELGLLKKARDILLESDDDEGNYGTENGRKKRRGLFELEFMKRGMEAQRTRAKEEARKLLEELQANELAATVSTDSEGDRNVHEKEEKKASKTKQNVATEAGTKKILEEGKLVASSLKFGKADGFSTRVGYNIELDGNGGVIEKRNRDNNDANNDVHEAKVDRKGRKKKKKNTDEKKNKDDNDDAAVAEDLSSNKAHAAVNDPESVQEEEENPWIVCKSSKKSNKPLSKTVDINDAASVLVDHAQGNGKQGKKRRGDEPEMDLKEKGPGSNANNETADPLTAVKDDDVGIADLSQAELVRRAFVAPINLEAEEEFHKEKERMKERDDPTFKKAEDAFVSGWGSWAGVGVPPPKKPLKLPPKLQARIKKAENSNTPKRKDDSKSTVIINEKRLKKTAKFQLPEIPYPYRSREEYERSITGNVGQEWNTILGVKEMSRPAVLVRAGKIIKPISKKAKMEKRAKKMSISRSPAKF